MKPITTLPEIFISTDGLPVSSHFLEALVSLHVLQKLSRPTVCEIVFDDPVNRSLDMGPFVHGKMLAIYFNDDLMPVFEGVVTAVEYTYESQGGRTVRIRCFDKMYLLSKQQNVRQYSKMTVPEIAGEMVADINLEVAAECSGPVWERLGQYRETDLDFLERIARRSGLYFFNHGDTLHFVSLNDGFRHSAHLVQGKTLFDCTFEYNAAPALTAVHVCGWNPSTAELKKGDASIAESDNESRTRERNIVDVAVDTGDEAETLSQACLDYARNREIVFSGTAEGDTRLITGTTVSIDGVAVHLQRRFMLTETEHCITTRCGYITRVSSKPPEHSDTRHGTHTSFGIVSNIDDPEKLGRVRVILPAYAEMETDWLNVLLPAAASKKGLFMLPDVDDQVLVLFLNDDPSRGVVLGGICGTSHQPDDWGIDGGRVNRYRILTKGGHDVVLNDDDESITITNTNGSFIKFEPRKTHLFSKEDMVIEAPGKNVTIRGDTIDFKKG